MSDRSCTCHPSEAPKPCQKRYALTDCQAARIEQLEREKAVVSDALQQQSDLNLKYTLEYNEMVAERNEFAARIEQLEAALRDARAAALEEAAKVADEEAGHCEETGSPPSDFGNAGRNDAARTIATAIRALKETA